MLDVLFSIVDGQRGATLQRLSAPARGSLALAALKEMDRIGLNLVKVKDVCTSLSVSRRAIEKSFDAVLGISPAQYLLACRLNHLRRALLGAAGHVADKVNYRKKLKR